MHIEPAVYHHSFTQLMIQHRDGIKTFDYLGIVYSP